MKIRLGILLVFICGFYAASYSQRTVSLGNDLNIKLNGPSSNLNFGYNLNGLSSGKYRITISVRDSIGNYIRDTMMLTLAISNGNQPPVANAGQDFSIINTGSSTSIVLSGNSSYDPDGSITSYRWTRISGASCTITNPSLSQTTVSGLTVGMYQFQLEVTDNGGLKGLDVVTVSVNNPPNAAPVVNAGTDRTVTLSATTNTFTLSGTATDADGTIVSYQWTKLSGPSATIVSPTMRQTVISGIARGTYIFRLTSRDNLGTSGSDTVTIVVN
jgi:hypothetical protein